MFQSLGEESYVNGKYQAVPRIVEVSAKKKGRLTIQCDQMWSFVGNKSNKQWIWLALDVKTREIVGVHVGDRSRNGAQGLWDAEPSSVSTVCGLLHGFLVGLRGGIPKPAASKCWQG